MKPLILASTSKYRQSLLQKLHLPFEAIAPEVDEGQFKKNILSPLELAQLLAKEKSQAIAKKFPHAVVIGSDQVACVDQIILDKPGNHENALKQLQLMNNREHYLYTAVCLSFDDKTIEFVDTTTLLMKKCTDLQLNRYLKIDQPYDCAGSYKIESLGITLFEKIDCQDFNAITGLPLIKLCQYLSEIGYELP
ncbi:MAG: septum formation protein Maf [Bdellovibrionales bacterium CG12_big_fil_rev_8_21_14_0_65_38_15]|nr:MAG: septum formation protein Maf [Bdellovibrionales bacterium CG22_combo_CG10-13_8_21_14_all_38_13]PIQ56657.1 MAG: septum formation protein Maf [Bdellovibrionales bacterium CG12_big_fil_rev_8_21_14_0_65_38_15]PIR31226.1 MAG: septum formation protein Maf [Bdellovibrionales bacterium CG11_big_fil_rev_8_21_14_0_20_38_13]